MLTLSWVAGSLRRRPGRAAATAVGIALAVGLLASIGAFLSASKATMTSRAAQAVAVDWQVEAQAGGDTAALIDAVAATPHVVAVEPVLFATSSGLQHDGGGTVQTTGAAQVLGLTDSYRTTFPDVQRDLAGAMGGVLLYQQTAANLHAGPGDTITMGRAGLDPVTVTVAGVVDLPQADSLFQPVGAPVGASAQAPPDNVVLVPATTWHRLFDPVAASRPDLVHTQVHARHDHRLGADPSTAYSQVTGQARNLEARLAGTALVGDNLAAALSSARADALYAQVLFLFLGVPGTVLAGLLTGSVVASGRDRRRQEQALLRTRGATTPTLVRLAGAEALVAGSGGAALGLALALIVGRTAFGTVGFGATVAAAAGWSVGAAVVGLVIAVAAIAVPAWTDATHGTVAGARRSLGVARTPRWMGAKVDVVLLVLAAVVFWVTSRRGYQLVLAVEGVPAISVDYWAFAGPALLWTGAGLLAYRIVDRLGRHGRHVLDVALRPLAGPLSDTVAANLQRQRHRLARGATLIALTVGFAASTATFNATYHQQAGVDAVLTNGADVTATMSPGDTVAGGSAGGSGSDIGAALAATPGVRHVEALQHRFAYVGADLQDLYGVDPRTIVDAGRLQDAYVGGGTVRQLVARLGAQPDGVLVSAETVHDFQLRAGDALTLRLQDGRTHQYVDVPFHYVGVVKEFPTAPRDSFLVANADYVAARTGSDTVGAFLIDTGGRHVGQVADVVRGQLGVRATVTDLVSTRRVIGSSLTAVDLAGLTRVELGFALALAAGATGLTLWLGLAERRRTLLLARALGADRRQLGAFVWAEVVLVTASGLATGAVIAWALSHMLVRVLHGVFDPAPASLAVPWPYLATVTAVCLASGAVAASVALAHARRPHLDGLREL